MCGKKNYSWLMTRQQSFIASVLFVSFFVLWFLWAAVGNQIGNWFDKNENLSGWVQAIGSIAAIFGIWWQTKEQFLNAERKSESERRSFLISLHEMVVETTKWMGKKLENKDLLVVGWSTKSLVESESFEEKLLFLDDLGRFERRFRMISNHAAGESKLIMDLERVISAIETMRLVMEKNLSVKKIIHAFEVLDSNAGYVRMESELALQRLSSI